jgi:hypothetical protein
MAEWRDDANKKRISHCVGETNCGERDASICISFSLFHSSSLLLVPFLLDLFIGRYTTEARKD